MGGEGRNFTIRKIAYESMSTKVGRRSGVGDGTHPIAEPIQRSKLGGEVESAVK